MPQQYAQVSPAGAAVEAEDDDASPSQELRHENSRAGLLGIKAMQDGRCRADLGLPDEDPTPSKHKPRPSMFYEGGLQHKHWVLVLCSFMILCEWMDRSIMSIAMQAIKEEFSLSDAHMGMMASSSLWMVPVTIAFAGRLSDHVPKSKLLGAGLLGWGGCTVLTGSARSFHAVIATRMIAGVANCAGYPLAAALLAQFFQAAELTTAMGYFNAGCAIGGLIGLVAGGMIITQLGWRFAFWCLGPPQFIVALLLATTVRDQQERAPKLSWCEDLRGLLRLPSLRLMMLGSTLQGLLSGNNRFVFALAERLYGLDTQTIGLVMGVSMGVTGVFSAWCGGHVIDRWVTKRKDKRVMLWCAVAGDLLHVLMGLFALLAPTIELFVVFLALATWSACLTLGIHTANQALAIGRRGTTQSLFELCWSIGMGLGPFTSGTLSDWFEVEDGSCGEGCALRRAAMLVGGLGYISRAILHLLASGYFREDIEKVEAEFSTDLGPPCQSDASPRCLSDASPLPRGRDVEDVPDDPPTSTSMGGVACTKLGKPALELPVMELSPRGARASPHALE